MKYYLIAGEASGDLHGSNLMKGLKNQDPEAEFRFWGGDKMSAVGGTLVRHYKDSAVMGLVEVIAKLGKISKNLSDCQKDILEYKPDVVILIDYPGFNLKIAKFCHSKGLKTFYYIAPKVWAWNESRIKLIKKWVDKVFIIFPFEIEYFKQRGIDAVYCGNPLIDSISQDKSAFESRLQFLERNNLSDKPILALFAGSRQMEIKHMMPLFVQLEKILSNTKYKDLQLVVAGAPSTDHSLYESYLENSNIKVVYGEAYSILRNSEAAIINSGTASLECALIGTPQVVGYGVNIITYLVGRLVVKLNYISLANIILDKPIFKELIQHECNPKRMCEEVITLLDNIDYREKMLADYQELREILGGDGSSERFANAMINSLRN